MTEQAHNLDQTAQQLRYIEFSPLYVSRSFQDAFVTAFHSRYCQISYTYSTPIGMDLAQLRRTTDKLQIVKIYEDGRRRHTHILAGWAKIMEEQFSKESRWQTSRIVRVGVIEVCRATDFRMSELGLSLLLCMRVQWTYYDCNASKQWSMVEIFEQESHEYRQWIPSIQSKSTTTPNNANPISSIKAQLERHTQPSHLSEARNSPILLSIMNRQSFMMIGLTRSTSCP